MTDTKLRIKYESTKFRMCAFVARFRILLPKYDIYSTMKFVINQHLYITQIYESNMQRMRSRNNLRKFTQPFQHCFQKKIFHQSSEQENQRQESQGLHQMPEKERNQIIQSMLFKNSPLMTGNFLLK